jgi:hypothetical protein
MPNIKHDTAIDTLAATPSVLASLLGPLPGEATDTPADGGWSPKDVLAHLILAERNGAIGRIRIIAERDDPPLPNRDEDAELAASGLRARPLPDLLAEFARLRNEDVRWLRSLDTGAWNRAGQHSAVGRVTASEFLYHAAYHDALHLGQLTTMVQAHFEPHRGAMRAF